MCEESNLVFYPADLIESEIRDNLRCMINAYNGSKLKVTLLYKGKVISNDTCEIITDNK